LCWDVVVGIYFLDFGLGIVFVLTNHGIQTTWTESAIKNRSERSSFPSAIGMVGLLYLLIYDRRRPYTISFEHADGQRGIHEHRRER
jgi:hypothetical protein